jgi:very-short-patch-repair endonuclease
MSFQNMPKTKLFNIKTKKQQRINLRQQPISCEKIFWYKLRNRAFAGLKFRRQYSISKYIVDFYCPKIKLAVEIDGATHSTDKEMNYDRQRQKYIESLNIKVIRYTNTEIKENLSGVMDNLYFKTRSFSLPEREP